MTFLSLLGEEDFPDLEDFDDLVDTLSSSVGLALHTNFGWLSFSHRKHI
jgi:hypothetical protein